MRVSIIAIALGATLGLTSEAVAGGYLVARFGAEHGHPTTDNPTALYYNPAALTLGTGTRLYIDGTLAFRSLVFDRDPGAIDNPLAAGEMAAGTPEEYIAANSGEGRLSAVAAAPFVGIASDFGVEGLGVALGFYVPFGGGAAWDQADPDPNHPGVVDGPQRWWAIEGTVRTDYLTAAVGWRLPGTRLSLGASLNLTHSLVNTTRARNASGHDHMVDVNGRLQEGRALVEADAWEPALGAGLLFEAMPDELWLGVSYQSQPNFGLSVLDGEALIVQATAQPTRSNVQLRHEVPDVWRFGLRWRPSPRGEVRLNGDWQRWSVLDTQCVIDIDAGQKCDGTTAVVALLPRYWDDSFGIRVGLSYWPVPNVEMVFGVGFDSNAVPDYTLEPGLYDTDKVVPTLGVRFSALDDALGLTLMYTQVLYFPREIRPRGLIEDSAVSATGGADVTESDVLGAGLTRIERNPDAAGRYDSTLGALNLSVEYRF